MGVGILVKRIFETSPVLPAAVTQAAFLDALEKKDSAERINAQRLINWYNRDRDEIVLHLKEAAGKKVENVEDWSFPVINGVPRTIKRLSTVYKDPPTRDYFVGDKPAPEATLEKIDKMYSRIDLDKKMVTLDRWSTLLNTVHAELVFRKGYIDIDVRLRPSVVIVPDPEDFLEFAAFAYRWEPMDPETLEPVKGWVYWTEEMHLFITGAGKMVGMSNKEGTNPYKDPESGEPLIPVVTVRKIEDIQDYWGRFGADLVDAQEAANVELGNMWETMGLQTHGWPVITNFGLPEGAVVKMGPKHPLVANKVTKEDHPPNVAFPKPDPDLGAVREVLDWFLRLNASAYGLPPSAWSLDEQALSGFSKFMDNIELLEAREEAVPQWQKIEADIFKKARIVYNYNAPDKDKIPEEVKLKVTFPKPRIPESPTEEATRWALAIKSDLASLVDYFMGKEGLDRDSATERAKETVEANRELGGIVSLARSRFLEQQERLASVTEEEEGA
jgi:hypothetical protein